MSFLSKKAAPTPHEQAMQQALDRLNAERRALSSTIGTLKWRGKKMDVVVEGHPDFRQAPLPPAVHIYRKGEADYMTPAFDFELSIAHLLRGGEPLLLQQTDRAAARNTLQGDWTDYEDLNEALQRFLSESRDGRTNLQRVVEEWNRLSDVEATERGESPLAECLDLLESLRPSSAAADDAPQS